MNLTEIKEMIVKGVGIVPAHDLLRLVAVAEAAMEKMDAEDQYDAALRASGEWSERTSKVRTEEGRASAKLRATLAGVTR